MTWQPSDDAPGRGRRHHAGGRAQRLLVRVLLALRGEACRARRGDEARVQRLADRIMLDLPRRLVPLGGLACAALALACLMPLLRDALPATGVVAAPMPAMRVVESGVRSRSEAMNEGLGALRAAVAPFASVDAEGEAAEGPAEAAVDAPKSAIAAAPFKKS